MDPRVQSSLAWLKSKSTQKHREALVRFAIDAKDALGVSMTDLQTLAKQLGRDHDLAEALWLTGVYEARLLAAYVDDPKQVTPAQMDRWRKDFDNWAVTDTLCFVLFDRTPHAWGRVAKWRKLQDEFGKRAAFALIASLALHDKKADDQLFIDALPLIEEASTDPRNFVKKGVSWALRAMVRRGPEALAAAEELAGSLAHSDDATARWIGKDALRDFAKHQVRVAAKKRPAKS